MNIALIILHADSAKGGAETYTLDLARALVDQGHTISLLAASFADNLDARLNRVPLNFSGATRVSQYEAFLDALDTHLSVQRYDVVHAMLPVRQCDLYHPHAGIAEHVISAGHMKHDSAFRRFTSRLANHLNRKRRRFAAVERALLLPEGRSSQGPIVICLSEYVKQTVRRHYPLPDDRMATLVNAVDLPRFDPEAATASGLAERVKHGIAANQIVALIVAQDFARKGLQEAIEAWKWVADERLVLMVVGKDDFAPYARLAEGSKYPKNLVYVGATRDVRPFYAAADFFVLPTRHDPCSLVVLEALAMGLPVVSTIFNGACEMMTPATHGYVLRDPGDTDALARTFLDLLNDVRRAAMHHACLKLRPKLAYEHHLNELVRLYERAMRKRIAVSAGPVSAGSADSKRV